MIKKLLIIIATLSLCACQQERTQTMYGNYKRVHIEMGNVIKHFEIDDMDYSYYGAYTRVHTKKGWISVSTKNIVLYESEECVLCGVVDYD